MNNEKEPKYEDLKKQFSDEEIADAFVLRGELKGQEKKEAESELRKLRLERLKSMSDQQMLRGQLFRMKLLMKEYFKDNIYLPNFSFASQLRSYLNLLNITHSQFAEDIGIHKTRLSRLINDREDPNIELLYRLEKHSGGLISASYWYKLYSRKMEADIKNNDHMRAIEANKVKNELRFESMG